MKKSDQSRSFSKIIALLFLIGGIAIWGICDLGGLLIIRHYLQMEVLAQGFLLIRCCPNCANHCLTGSAFLEGID